LRVGFAPFDLVAHKYPAADTDRLLAAVAHKNRDLLLAAVEDRFPVVDTDMGLLPVENTLLVMS
jgi:hypothetical protein